MAKLVRRVDHAENVVRSIVRQKRNVLRRGRHSLLSYFRAPECRQQMITPPVSKFVASVDWEVHLLWGTVSGSLTVLKAFTVPGARISTPFKSIKYRMANRAKVTEMSNTFRHRR